MMGKAKRGVPSLHQRGREGAGEFLLIAGNKEEEQKYVYFYEANLRF